MHVSHRCKSQLDGKACCCGFRSSACSEHFPTTGELGNRSSMLVCSGLSIRYLLLNCQPAVLSCRAGGGTRRPTWSFPGASQSASHCQSQPVTAARQSASLHPCDGVTLGTAPSQVATPAAPVSTLPCAAAVALLSRCCGAPEAEAGAPATPVALFANYCPPQSRCCCLASAFP